jgi:hypothetical protein
VDDILDSMNWEQKFILKKMIYLKYIGSRHTSTDNIIKGSPKSERDKLKKALKYLIKENYILTKPTSYGLQISINPKRINEILEIIRNKVE